MKLNIGLVTFALLLLGGCSYFGSSDPINTDGSRFNNKTGQDQALDFVNLSAIFVKKCLYCHRDHSFLTTPSGVQARSTDITNWVFILGTMPPLSKPQLTECELDILREYLEKGDQPDKRVSELEACKLNSFLKTN